MNVVVAIAISALLLSIGCVQSRSRPRPIPAAMWQRLDDQRNEAARVVRLTKQKERNVPAKCNEAIKKASQEFYGEWPRLKRFKEIGYRPDPSLSAEENQQIEATLSRAIDSLQQIEEEEKAKCIREETEKVLAARVKAENALDILDEALKKFYPSYRY